MVYLRLLNEIWFAFKVILPILKCAAHTTAPPWWQGQQVTLSDVNRTLEHKAMLGKPLAFWEVLGNFIMKLVPALLCFQNPNTHIKVKSWCIIIDLMVSAHLLASYCPYSGFLFPLIRDTSCSVILYLIHCIMSENCVLLSLIRGPMPLLTT